MDDISVKGKRAAELSQAEGAPSGVGSEWEISDYHDKSHTPIANRGIPAPPPLDSSLKTPFSYSGCHWWSETVWGSIGDVLSTLDSILIERNYASTFAGWECRGGKGRITAQWVAKGIGDGCVVNEFGDSPYVSIEVPGHVCEWIGDEGLHEVFSSIRAAFDRTQASRLDFAFDGLPATVDEVARCCMDGHWRSPRRCHLSWNRKSSDTGTTVYIRDPRKDPEAVRIYDQRGPVRWEVVARKHQAKNLANIILARPVDDWSDIAAQFSRSLVVFTRPSSTRVERCAHATWYQEAFGNGPIQKLPRADVETQAKESDLVQKLGSTLQRFARTLERARRAFGSEWLISAVERESKARWTDEDEDVVSELRRLRGWMAKHRILGVPPIPESSGDDGFDCPI